MRLLALLVVIATAGGCKARSDQSALRDAAATPTPSTAQVAAAQPLAGAQFGTAQFATGTCFGTPGAWGDGGTPGFDAPEILPPGSTRFVRPDKVSSAYAGWTRSLHDSFPGVEVFDARVDAFPDLLSRFGSGDPTSVPWYLTQSFGQALAAGLENLPADQGKYGVILLRRVLANQRLAAAPGAATGAVATADAYARCGDGYLAGQVVTDEYMILVASKDGAKRDAVMDTFKKLVLSQGDFDQAMDAAIRALDADSALLTLDPADSGMALSPHAVADAEGAMNRWRGSDQPTGFRSLLGAVEAYPAFTSEGSATSQIRPALVTMATWRDGLRGLSGAARQTQQQRLDALTAQVTDCGGKRFGAGGTGPAASCSQLNATGITDDRLAGFFLDRYHILGSYPGNPCNFDDPPAGPKHQRHPGRGEFQALMNTDKFKREVYNRYFTRRSGSGPDRSWGPTWDRLYEYFWIRPAASDPAGTKMVARVEDRRTAWFTGLGEQNPNRYAPDYPFEITFEPVTGTPLTDYNGWQVCIDPAPGEAQPTNVEDRE